MPRLTGPGLALKSEALGLAVIAELHLILAMMKDELPVALGVIRDVEAPCYDAALHAQMTAVQAQKKDACLYDVLMRGETWEVK